MRNASTQFRFHGEKHDDDTRKKRTRSQNLCRTVRSKAEGSTDKCKTYARTSRRGSRSGQVCRLFLGSRKELSPNCQIRGIGKTLQIEKNQGSVARRIVSVFFRLFLQKVEEYSLTFLSTYCRIAIVNSAMANPKKFQIRPHVPS